MSLHGVFGDRLNIKLCNGRLSKAPGKCLPGTIYVAMSDTLEFESVIADNK